ncbi:potassium-transporting ATPase subunit KdpA [Arthrobacter livingstonensis]|uniref:Potassium-transporting ATPase potassium-binding subunit n=1 Tax=Arthrobacter livingstonensis TaxID=670078 RepID=A0A2V5L8J1_9MICC|nr:potassium-transporting ATPase subunit KdpA [Arthrobacter livingstonensis]PYI67815.1 potassium-transporting ATPase subunit KdpA [Arthrobacter livingstonensis]
MELNVLSLITQVAVLILLLGALHQPMGRYLAATFTSRKHLAVERGLYKLSGIDSAADQHWKVYLRSLLAFSIVSILVVLGGQMLQGHLPFNQGMGAVDPWVAMNTAVSFVTNTNWQTYVPESTLGFGVQMLLLAVQNFLSAAVGLAVVVALIRGLVRAETHNLGNFWVDLTRGTLRVLLPLSILGAVVLIVTGVIQNWGGTDIHTLVTGAQQTVPGGPVASQEAIKLLGTNGGGYFNANSAHPFENPTAFSSLFEVFLILLIPFSLPAMYGRMVGDKRQGYTVLTVMVAFWLGSTALMTWAVAAFAGQGTGVGEGFEQRFGIAPSTLFATATTLTSTGAVNVAHDSLPPLAGGLAMLNMMLGEIAPGGVGSGLYGLLVLAIVAVFIGGLMVGRTPEFLGKKIGSAQMKLVALYILVTPTLVLLGTAITVSIPYLSSNAPAEGPHGFSEILYAFTSAANNNGSAFGGITSSGPGLATMLALAMLLGRFLPIALVLALAGSLAKQRKVPDTSGTLATHGPLFATLLGGVSLLVAALTYFPALALGPAAEGLIK